MVAARPSCQQPRSARHGRCARGERAIVRCGWRIARSRRVLERPARSRQRRRSQSRAPRPPPATPRPRRAIAAQRQLHDHRPARSRPAARSTAKSCSPGATRRRSRRPSPALPSLLQRLAQHAARRGCASAILAGDTELADRPESDWGWIDVTSVKLMPRERRAGRRRRSSLRSSRPTTAMRTIGRWRRSRSTAPVAPGQTVNVQIALVLARAAHLRAHRRRSATTTSSRSGSRRSASSQDAGWNCHQFHAATEFFADFGIYDVRLTVPTGWIVGATGAERGRRDEGDRTTTHHYYAEDVHDFAWTTSPDYRRADRALRARRRCRR